MAKLKTFETYDIIDGTTANRIINVDHIVEITSLSASSTQPLSRLTLVTGAFVDVKKAADELKNAINLT